jgi:hypothetical protein
MYIQSTNSSILKNLCQAKQKNHNNKKKMNINLLQHLWLTHDHDRIDQMLLLSIEYIYISNLIIRRMFSRMSI